MIKTMQDRQPGLVTSAITGALTLTKTGTTARTVTFPDAAITVAGQNLDNAFSVAQTIAGSVPGVPVAGQVLIGGGTINTLADTNAIAQLSITNTSTGTTALAQTIINGGGNAILQAPSSGYTGNRLGQARASSMFCGTTSAARVCIGSTNSASVFIGTNDTTRVTIDGSTGAITCTSTLSATSLTASGLTAGCVAVAGAGGLLGATSSLLFDGTSLTTARVVASGAVSAGTYAFDIVANNSVDRSLARFGISGITNGFTIGFTQSTGALAYSFLGGTGSAGSATFAVPVTVPNGTAAAPGIRLTGEAHGLYRVSATSLGISVAGVVAAYINEADASASKSFVMRHTDAALPVWITNNMADGLIVLGGPTAAGITTGGQVRVYGGSHASKAAFVEFTRGATVSAFFNATGVLTLNATTASTTTATGALVVSGGVGVGGNLWTGGYIYSTYAATNAHALSAVGTVALGAGVTDSFACGLDMQPTFNGAFTVTRHNYWRIRNPALTGSAALTDACVMQFDAAAGTHKALAAATSTSYDGSLSGSIKVNINGTIGYIPVRASIAGSGVLTVTDATASSNTTTGALVVSGGVGVGGAIYGGSILNLPASAATTVAGNLQRETNQDTHYAYTNGIGGWVDKCIFSQYATVTQSGIVTAQSLASGTARGTRTLPANFFKLGKVLKFRLCGSYTTDAGAGNATIAINLGGTAFRTTGSFALDNSVTAGYWVLDGEISCQSTGVSGTVAGQVAWVHAQTSPPAESALYEQPMTTTGAVTIDTTASAAFDVVWTATDAGTSIVCSCFRLWEVC